MKKTIPLLVESDHPLEFTTPLASHSIGLELTLNANFTLKNNLHIKIRHTSKIQEVIILMPHERIVLKSENLKKRLYRWTKRYQK